jgi:hypothetical protein
MMGELMMEALATRPGRLQPFRLGLPKFPRSEDFGEFVGQITADDD